jgi:HEPN domain-containing protein
MRRLLKEKPPLHDLVCFHGQQAAEKYLKGLMQALGLTIPKAHDLDLLLAPLVAHHPSLSSLRRGLVYLTQFAVETRYPGKKAQKRQALAAARWTERVRKTVRAILGI